MTSSSFGAFDHTTSSIHLPMSHDGYFHDGFFPFFPLKGYLGVFPDPM